MLEGEVEEGETSSDVDIIGDEGTGAAPITNADALRKWTDQTHQPQGEPVVVISDPAQPHATDPFEVDVNRGQTSDIPPPPVTGGTGVDFGFSPGISNFSWNYESVWKDLFLSEEAQVPQPRDDPSTAVPRAPVETHCNQRTAALSHTQGFSASPDL